MGSRHTRTPLRLALAAATLGLVLPGGTEKEFEESLQVVDRTIGSGKGKKAKELLLAAIDAHRDDAFVLYHLSEVEDLLRRAAFWSSNTKPESKSLISGNLVSWSATTGEIKLRYAIKSDKAASSKSENVAKKPGHLSHPEFADFVDAKQFCVHPLTFDGPFTVEVKGSTYPEFSEPVKPPEILVCADWNRSTCVEFGLSAGDGGKYVRAELLQIEGEDVTKLDQAMPTCVPGAEYVAKVVVATSTVTAYLDDKRILSAPRPGPIDGRFAFGNFRGVREVVITGKVTPSWLMNVVDEAIQQRWSAFEKTYKAADDLPAWLRERAWSGVQPESDSEDVLPDEKSDKGRAHLEQFAKLLREGKSGPALELAEKAPAGELSEGSRAFLRAVALRRLGRRDEALEACAKACSLEPRCLPARRLRIAL